MAKEEDSLFEELVEKERAEVESKAKQYLYTQKKRKPYYDFFISSVDNPDEEEMLDYYCSEEEFAHLSQLLIDAFNKKFPSDGPIATIDELNEKRYIYELLGVDAELDAKLDKFLTSYTERSVIPIDIGTDPHYQYGMSCYFWDSATGRMSKRYRFSVELTDEEYIYLLTEQLLDRSTNTYNRLVFDRPDLAKRICNSSNLSYITEFEIKNNPYLIILDELLEDAEVIDGPECVDEYIYADGGIIPKYIISGHTKGRQLYICEDNCLTDKPLSELRELKEIDADKVQKLLGARNYTQMIQSMRSLCSTSSPFDAIKAWLDKEQLSYKESTGPKN